ncbi:uncharacterized protein STEHIDRAFT_56247 [Stereum hirsutum FP-91666 SS1]|uniref:uncharacterized protein n=1 Tax=Stereum hirsutum (strain FP-91666) TaxID=721885 RepID=UPI000440FB93|nr:uncharacterized protein STEHIDRAFT_56247 [Stereum hirsutum FP-91666 SS1]EIM87672.1 hypothetical protein STEHIDRAFT_56247 [Stereum hirsutum FP-91666 SS1]
MDIIPAIASPSLTTSARSRPRHTPHRIHRITCPYPRCPQTFLSHKGRTYHIRSVHAVEEAYAAPAPAADPVGGQAELEAQGDNLLDGDDLHLEVEPAYDDEEFPELDVPRVIAPQVDPRPRGMKNYHPRLTGRPCDANGVLLAPGTPPLPRTTKSNNDWSPYENKTQFLLADFLYRKAQMSARNVDELMEIWDEYMSPFESFSPYTSARDLLETIDLTTLGDAPWHALNITFSGEAGPTSPSWMSDAYEVWYRDPLIVAQNILDNPDFASEFDYAAYVELGTDGKRRWSDFMSGNLAWRHSDSIYADDPTTQDAMYCPIILGSDKTTVSVATGQLEYWPVYFSIGNIHNNVRRAHRNGVVPIAFLAIPKSTRRYDNDEAFRAFKHRVYHASLDAIFQAIHQEMTSPVVLRCPDGHFRRVIFGLGAYIADYPEQVTLSGVVSDWCPKCTAYRDDLDGPAVSRTQSLYEDLVDLLGTAELRTEYGINAAVEPFTLDLPRADIYEMISPDVLHQLIKGTFKDHLVDWVGEYLALEHGSEARAGVYLDEIDRRIAATPPFAGLRHFHDGRRFKQWTGDDSKGLMKVYLPALVGLVDDDIVRTITAFLDFIYIARRQDLDEISLKDLDRALVNFHRFREVFRTSGVRPTGFNLPRQHSLVHYHHHIVDFGAPNGLCSSITESRHITAVKKPWRRSNRNNALGQMLVTNQRLDKLAASYNDFVERGMLPRTHYPSLPEGSTLGGDAGDDFEGGPVNDERVSGHVTMARTPARGYPSDLSTLAIHIGEPTLPELTRRFLYDQLLAPDLAAQGFSSDDVDSVDDLPLIFSSISVFHSAVATFYAPSDESGIHGMRRERIRSTRSWRKGPARRDCAFVVQDQEEKGMKGLDVVRILLLFSFRHDGVLYPCALVHWYKKVGRSPDSVSGMWKVKPDEDCHGRVLTVVHLDSLFRAAHLIPVYGKDFRVPSRWKHTDSLDAFATFYVNKFVDHHAHEIAF